MQMGLPAADVHKAVQENVTVSQSHAVRVYRAQMRDKRARDRHTTLCIERSLTAVCFRAIQPQPQTYIYESQNRLILCVSYAAYVDSNMRQAQSMVM